MALRDRGSIATELDHGMRLGGLCRALYAFDVARSIDLARAAELLASSRRTTYQRRHVTEDGVSPPIRLPWRTPPRPIGTHVAREDVEVAVYEIGAVCITWTIPFDAPASDLVGLSALLYDNAEMIDASRAIALEVVSALGSAMDRPRVADGVEDYVVFQATPTPGGPPALMGDGRHELARLLRAEEGSLSEQEVADALARPVSYDGADVCLVDWLAAFLMGADTEDERLVLEHAIVQLLELRLLDAHLDRGLEEAYELLVRRRRAFGSLAVRRRELEQLSRMQADDALIHEGIDNAIKLFGDGYLARLYRECGQRLRFPDWDRSIQRKLGVLRTVYESLAGQASHRRNELLEWVIILLIAVDILVYMLPR